MEYWFNWEKYDGPTCTWKQACKAVGPRRKPQIKINYAAVKNPQFSALKRNIPNTIVSALRNMLNCTNYSTL